MKDEIMIPGEQKLTRMGRPPAFLDVQEFLDKASGFEEWRKKNNYLYTLERFCTYLGVDRDTLLRYENKDGIDEFGNYNPEQDFCGPIKSVKALILAETVEGGLTGRFNPAMSIFLLKANYQYQDKVEIALDSTIRIVTDGDDEGLDD